MKSFKFTATITQGDGGGAYVLFPFDVASEFGARGRVPVRASFNGIPYSGSLSKCGGAEHVLGVLKSIRDQLGFSIGDEIEVEVWKDDAIRTVAVPADLLHALHTSGTLAEFENLSYTRRKEYCRWIEESKTEQTRNRRIGNAVDGVKNKANDPDRSSRRKT